MIVMFESVCMKLFHITQKVEFMAVTLVCV